MTWRENIERVREALKIATMNNTYVHLTHPEAQGVLDALTALTAQIEALNGENASLNAENRDLLEKWSARGTQMKELERERDSLVKQSLAQGAWMEGAMPNFSEVAAADARAEAAEQRVEELEGARNAAERMFAAAVYAMPDSEITVWPVHLEVDLTLERYDDPLNKCSRFRAALAQFDPPEDSE